MGKSDTGKIVAVLGGIIALVAVLLSLLPSDVSWWYIHFDSWPNWEAYLNAFGFFTDFDDSVRFLEDYLIILGGLVVLAGAILMVYGAAKDNKSIAVISGIIMIIGLIVFCVALNANEDWEDLSALLSFLNGADVNPFFGTSGDWRWGLGIGFYIGAAGAVIGTIGSFYMD